MFINKIGYEHIEIGKNNQDFGFYKPNDKCVVDGCSEGAHSEVGSKLYCLYRQFESVGNAYVSVLEAVANDMVSNRLKASKASLIRDYACFTILNVFDNSFEDFFLISHCGDGYIIKQKHDGTIEFEKLDDGEYPKYLAYNYLPTEYLKGYKNGVGFEFKQYSKSEYKNIGVASDGLRFVIGTPFEEELKRYLVAGKESAIKRLINREQKLFKDDITISF